MISKLFGKNRLPKDLPGFFQEYVQSLKDMPDEISKTRFVVFDTETTGLNTETDRVLSIGALSVKNKQIDISSNLEIYVEQEIFNPDSVKIHGLIRNEKYKKVSEEEAVKKFLEYCKNSVLVAQHAGFDVKMINACLKRMGLPKFQNPVLDTAVMYKKTKILTNLIDREKIYSLDEIAEAYNIDLVDRHTASGDAYITALIFLKLLGRIPNTEKLGLQKLIKLKY